MEFAQPPSQRRLWARREAQRPQSVPAVLVPRLQCRASRRQASRRHASAQSGSFDTWVPTVLVTDPIGSAGLEMLERYANVDLSFGMTPEQLLEKIPTADALIVRSATKVTRAVFEASRGRLQVVGRAGVGVDNVDLAAATEHGCLVVNAPTANTVAAAEHGIALLCAMARNIPQADASMKRGEWNRQAFVGTSLTRKTLAVIGFGKVGSEVARRAKALGMEVLVHDPYASSAKAAALGVRLSTFDECLQVADFFSLHMPLLPSTKHLFNEASFAKMKRGVRIVNVARGGVIDEAALLQALESGQVAQAALDVFSEEPPGRTTNPLLLRPDVICTPHLGASTAEALDGVAIEVVEAVVEALSGRLTPNALNAPMVPAEIQQELAPFITLAQGLGRAAVSLVSETGFTDVSITYSSPRGDDLDTRLLRANVLKGLLEGTTTACVNLVNADLLARNRGLRVQEVTVRGEDNGEVLTGLSVALGTDRSKFTSAVDRRSGRIYIEGAVRGMQPRITKIGGTDVDVAVEGSVLLTRQRDQPGIVAGVSSLLAEEDINISFMQVCRTRPSSSQSDGGEAIMAIGVDEQPSDELIARVARVRGVVEAVVLKDG